MLYYDVIMEDFGNSIHLDETIQNLEECGDEILSERIFYHPYHKDDFAKLGNFHSIYNGLLEVEYEETKEKQKIFITFLKDETQYFVVNIIESSYGTLFYAAKADNVFDLMDYLYHQNDSWSYVPNLKEYFDPIIASLPKRIEKQYLDSLVDSTKEETHLKIKTKL